METEPGQGGPPAGDAHQPGQPSGTGAAPVPEHLPPGVAPQTPPGPVADLGPGIQPAGGPRLTETIRGRLTDQARRTASAAKARRVTGSDGEPGVLDLTPLRELLSELAEELGKLQLRDRVASALRQAADVIDTRTPNP